MGASLSHMIVIDNKTDCPLVIRKGCDLDSEGRVSRPLIVVEPQENRPISSSKVFNNWSITSRPRFIGFYRNGVRFHTLSPGDFSANKAFIVKMNNRNIPFVTPIPQTPTISHSDRTEEPLLSGGSGLKRFCLC